MQARLTVHNFVTAVQQNRSVEQVQYADKFLFVHLRGVPGLEIGDILLLPLKGDSRPRSQAFSVEMITRRPINLELMLKRARRSVNQTRHDDMQIEAGLLHWEDLIDPFKPGWVRRGISNILSSLARLVDPD